MAFHVLEQLSRLQDGYKKSFNIEGHKLLLIHENGHSYLIEDRCPHKDLPLSTGTVTPDGKLRCSAHGIAFELNSGKATGPMGDVLDCLTRFDLVYEGSTVGVEL
ncbi:Rieske (2Fe-2S) protein [Agaribacterium sp. ZY112]|uniref:Rieske (2Fe-2S) protein n=1 Tax=Agaribacterium sp. ZY112 TaxID=3233574 RepID=UPI0035253489